VTPACGCALHSDSCPPCLSPSPPARPCAAASRLLPLLLPLQPSRRRASGGKRARRTRCRTATSCTGSSTSPPQPRSKNLGLGLMLCICAPRSCRQRQPPRRQRRQRCAAPSPSVLNLLPLLLLPPPCFSPHSNLSAPCILLCIAVAQCSKCKATETRRRQGRASGEGRLPTGQPPANPNLGFVWGSGPA
jgi:hypothetical protein